MTERDGLNASRRRDELVRQAVQESTYPTCFTAQEVLDLLDATTDIIPWICVPSDVSENHWDTLRQKRQQLLDALRPFGWTHL